MAIAVSLGVADGLAAGCIVAGGDVAEAKGRIERLLKHCRERACRVLVVVGAGCSRRCGIPLMDDVFSYLAGRAESKASSIPVPGPGETNHLKDLAAWLGVLKDRGGPRSLAARALGLLQRPHLVEDDGQREAIQDIWAGFAEDFLCWKVTPGERQLEKSASTILGAEPSEFHKMVAEWVANDLAFVLSLNFDGLTRKAVVQQCNGSRRCAILARRDDILRYWFGVPLSGQGEPERLLAVVKLWGDVFHATCINAQCPSFGKNVPLYELQASPTEGVSEQPDVRSMLRCPDCSASRQMQIFFTGYQKKEGEADLILDALRAYVKPMIGGIITVGVSGKWDAPLVRFLAETGQHCQRDELGPDERVLCVDSAGAQNPPFLATELRRRGVRVRHLAHKADDLAGFLEVPGSPGCDVAEISVRIALPQGPVDWSSVLCQKGQVLLPECLSSLLPADASEAIEFKEVFEKLRQLGLKTEVLGQEGAEDHNRYNHSCVAAVIAIKWIKHLLEEPREGGFGRMPASLVTSVTCLAALFHDLNHLPFTHLTEEVYGELNWTTADWGPPFSHDAAVLESCHEALGAWASEALDKVHKKHRIKKNLLTLLVTRAIEGRSGIPAVDAVLNSPIDCDKVEYLASDCSFMKKEVRLPFREPKVWKEWVESLFEGQRVLPSGTVGIAGAGAEKAYELLIERRWLYKHLYFRPGFRALERVLRHLLVRWLPYEVNKVLAGCLIRGESLPSGMREMADDPLHSALGARTIHDSRALKGRVGGDLLWRKLKEAGSEPCLAKLIAKEVMERHKGTPNEDWYGQCNAMIDGALSRSGRSRSYDQFETDLMALATCSSRMYLARSDAGKAREIVRDLEFCTDQEALIDFAATPRMLAYPPARRQHQGRGSLLADCWAVPHKDPDRWRRDTGEWVPLSDTVLAKRDENSWVQVLIVSPRPKDLPALHHVEDQFRRACDRHGVKIRDEDPEGE